ncbi:PKD repeat protein [Kribbella amoyensis]|uniref:PKD repeat protein n=1 Tax=Kribbella amoyensis TaxID=996641 RepID=A0A561BWL6_9ACTN|nr:PKD domain-containing protein [Kribbella amoyensis]TWD83284.1 PKD repeat protein [Kribbella amoyensis]
MALRRWPLFAVVLALVAALGLAATEREADAVQLPQTTIVSDNPVDWTPHALNGEVHALIQIGNRVIVGGTFTTIRSATSSTQISRRSIFAYNATTGALDPTFLPVVNGSVDTLLASDDGQSVYIGGGFTTVNGTSQPRLARVNLDNGSLVTTFRPSVNRQVYDLKKSGGRLYLGGLFTAVGGQPRTVLAAVDPDTGAVDPFLAITFAAPVRGAELQVDKFDITPDGSKLIAIGNFSQVGGLSRTQIVMLDLAGATATVRNWHTARFEPDCSSQFWTYVHDVDFSPDGAYFVVVTTGGTPPNRLCDSASRWETNATGSNLQPSWINYTGGDTLWSVGITSVAVYIGGHQRWVNNTGGSNNAAPGAVSREGLAALDPLNGLPFSWNPTRTRGVGVFDLTAVPGGLLMGSDTDRVGQNYEFHGRLAMFPNSSLVPPPGYTGQLPGPVYRLGATTTVRSYDGTTAGSANPVNTGTTSFANARGAVMIDGNLYTGTTDGTLTRRTFNGTTFGPAATVNLRGLTAFATDLRNATGMYFSNGRLFYTVAGQSSLYYRYFTPESQVVGASRFVASGNLTGVNWSQVAGMFLSGNQLYWATSGDGNLHRVNFANNVPVAGTAVVVSGPGIDGQDWRSQGSFLLAGTGPVPNIRPSAAWSGTCDLLACDFSGTGSSDPDGSIATYEWDFGDGSTATGATPSHTYTAPGSYTVTLTVTDNEGATGTDSRPLTVSDVANPIEFVGANSSNQNALTHTVTVPPATSAGDGLLLFFTQNTSATLTGPTGVTGWTLLRTVTGSGYVTRVWQKVAGPNDANQSVSVNLSAYSKAGLTVAAYSGTSQTSPVGAFASATETVTRAGHTTPVINSTIPGAWRVSYWADKSSATTAWTAPAGEQVRSTSFGLPSGYISTLLTDRGAAVPTGSQGGLTATANSSNSSATMWTLLLSPR